MPLTLCSDRFWISPWVFTCFLALREKGLPFELVEVALDRRETRTPDFQQRTITAKVPALDHDGFWLAESQAILEYLEETFAPPHHPRVLPADVRQRARTRQVMSFLRTDLQALREERSTETMFYPRETKPLSAKAVADAQKLFAVADAVVQPGATSMFDAWNLADSELAFCLQRLGLNGDELPARLRPFVDAQWTRPAVQAYVTRARPPFVRY